MNAIVELLTGASISEEIELRFLSTNQDGNSFVILYIIPFMHDHADYKRIKCYQSQPKKVAREIFHFETGIYWIDLQF